IIQFAGGIGRWACWGAALVELAPYPNLRKDLRLGFGYAARTAATGGGAGVGVKLRCGDLAADEVEQLTKNLARAANHFAVDFVQGFALAELSHQCAPGFEQFACAVVTFQKFFPAAAIGFQ